jgi:hypothetical protein
MSHSSFPDPFPKSDISDERWRINFTQLLSYQRKNPLMTFDERFSFAF